MKLLINGWKDGGAIVSRFAFGKPGGDEPFAPSDNISPGMKWSEVPEGVGSFALVVHDPDVPTVPDDVNQAGREVPADLKRCDFYHWTLVDIPADTRELPEGAGGKGIMPRGKQVGKSAYGITGLNDYTGWFTGDADMEGIYGGYDGPCPPWNDSIVHNYIFTLYALNVESLGLSGEFSGAEVVSAMQGHILDKAVFTGKYSMNPTVPVG